MTKLMYYVLLYYKLRPIKNPEEETRFHKEVCSALQLKGRILIGKDGINGTVGGSKESIELYKAYMNEHRLFKDIAFKESTSEIDPFPKLRVKAREEIITTEARETFDICQRGQHISPDTFHAWLKSGEDMVLLDMRNDYEWEIGRFVNSVRPPMKFFRDLKDRMDFYDQFKGNPSTGLPSMRLGTGRARKIVMFCTGGIRCEPASAMFLARGFDPKTIYQLEGGIVTYAQKYGNDGFYEGKCFVFDDRIAIPVNTSDTAVIVGRCASCTVANDTYRNCANLECNKLFLSCEDCFQVKQRACSHACEEKICALVSRAAS